MKILSCFVAQILGLSVLWVVFFLPLHDASAQKPVDVFKSETFEDGGFTLSYRLYIPDGLPEGERVPLLVFLHGAGQRGSDNAAQLVLGIPSILSYVEKRNIPVIILAPQCPQGAQWVSVPWGGDAHTMPVKPSAPLGAVQDLVPEIISKYPVNESRIYLTGISMGGFGAWDYLQREPDRFAAVVPICGGGDLAMAPRLVGTPIQVFHGALDKTVKPHRSRDMVEAIRAAGGSLIQYTEYPDVAHASWTPAYQSESLLDWLFQQRKPDSESNRAKTSGGEPRERSFSQTKACKTH